MPSFFRIVLSLASTLVCVAVSAHAQLSNVAKTTNTAGQKLTTMPPECTGQVRYGDTGKPAAGVRVYFQSLHEGNCPIQVATTDAKGVFHLPNFNDSGSNDEIPQFQVDDPSNRYAAEIRIGRPTSDGAIRFIARTGAGDSSTFITLKTGTFVSGTVTDATTHLPLAGVHLYSRGPHNQQTFYSQCDGLPTNAYDTMTDAAGHYRLPVAPGECEVAINHQTLTEGGYGYEVKFTAVKDKTTTVNLILPPDQTARLKREDAELQARADKLATVVTGRVLLYGTNMPAANRRIAIETFEGRTSQQTDKEGRFVFSKLASDAAFHLYLVTLEDYDARLLLTAGRTISGKTVTVPDISFSPKTVVQGTITGSISGEPIGGIEVLCGGDSVTTGQLRSGDSGGKTGPDGRYHLVVSPGTARFVRAASQSSQVLSGTFTIAPNETRTIDLKFAQAFSVEGTVVNEAGKPIAAVPVGIGRYDDLGAQGMFDMTNHRASDAAGHWSVPDLAQNTAGYCVLVGAGWQVVRPMPTQPLTLAPGAKIEVVLRRLPTITVTGRVLTQEDAPVSGAAVAITVRVKSSRVTSTYPLTVTTDADGRYTVGPLSASADVWVTGAVKPGFKLLPGGGYVSHAASSASAIAAPLKMETLSRTVQGQVVDERNRPVAGALVWSPDGDALAATTHTDAAGMFTLHGLPEDSETPVQITASQGNRVGVAKIAPRSPNSQGEVHRESNPTIITLQAPTPFSAGNIDDARAVAEALWNDGKNVDGGILRATTIDLLAHIAPDEALTFAGQTSPEEAAELRARVWTVVAHQRARDPQVEAWCERRFLSIADLHERSVAEAEVGLALAGVQKAVAERLIDQAQADDVAAGSHDLVNRVHLNALAVLCGREQTGSDGLTAEVRALTAAPDAANLRRRYALFLGRNPLPTVPALIETVVRPLEPYRRFTLYRTLTSLWVDTDPARANTYLAALTTLSDASGWQRNNRNALALRVATALAPINLDAAKALLPTLSPSKQNIARALIAHNAGNAAATKTLWDEVQQQTNVEADFPHDMALYAALSEPELPEQAKSFRQRAAGALERSPGVMEAPNIADEFAFYAASFNPALARQVAEESYARLRDHAPGQRWVQWMSQAALAMAAIDPQRGIAMMNETVRFAHTENPGQERYVRVAQRDLAYLLLLPPSTRRTVSIETDYNDLPRD